MTNLPVHVNTLTGTWGLINNGFGADTAFRVCIPPDPMEEFNARLDGTTGPKATYEWHGIDYPAQGFGINSVLSMDESCEVALNNGVEQINRTAKGTKHVLAGYSQGAIPVWMIAKEFLPGGRIDRPDDLLLTIGFGDPTCPEGYYAAGYGITRYVWPEVLGQTHLSYNNPWDMYGIAPTDTYLHIGFLALKQFKLDFMAMIQLMITMIQRDEFVDAIVELLDPLTPGLLDSVMELTGLGRDESQALINTKKPVTGGVLGDLIGGGNILGGLAGDGLFGLVGIGTGFIGGYVSNLSGLGNFGKIAGGLLGGGSGSDGTNRGWVKMGKTFAHLTNFATSGDHGRYWDPQRRNWGGMTAVDHAVGCLWKLAAAL